MGQVLNEVELCHFLNISMCLGDITWLIHVNVWQKPLHYYKVISL